MQRKIDKMCFNKFTAFILKNAATPDCGIAALLVILA